MKELFAVTDANGLSWDALGRWALPSKGENGEWIPGDWTPPARGNLSPYAPGYRLYPPDALIWHLGPAIYEAEVGGADELIMLLGRDIYETEVRPDVIEVEGVVIARTVRLLRRCEAWNWRTALLFVCDCAERAANAYKARNGRWADHAIAAARRYARDEITDEDMFAAWQSAARAAQALYWGSPALDMWLNALRPAIMAAAWAASANYNRDKAAADVVADADLAFWEHICGGVITILFTAERQGDTLEWQKQRLMEYLAA